MLSGFKGHIAQLQVRAFREISTIVTLVIASVLLAQLHGFVSFQAAFQNAMFHA